MLTIGLVTYYYRFRGQLNEIFGSSGVCSWFCTLMECEECIKIHISVLIGACVAAQCVGVKL